MNLLYLREEKEEESEGLWERVLLWRLSEEVCYLESLGGIAVGYGICKLCDVELPADTDDLFHLRSGDGDGTLRDRFDEFVHLKDNLPEVISCALGDKHGGITLYPFPLGFDVLLYPFGDTLLSHFCRFEDEAVFGGSLVE